MLEILTPLSKATRVSRKVDPENFISVPGLWGVLDATGGIVNVTTDDPQPGTRLVISNSNQNQYEAHDIEVGRITTLETPGIRCRVDVAGYVDSGDVAVGLDLVVSCESGDEGKLAVAISDGVDVAAGDYDVVARVEEFDAVENILTFVTVSPRTVVIS